MSRRDPLVAIRQMIDHAREAIGFARDRSRIDLASDRMFQLALVRLLEIIGEAATRVDEPTRAKLASVPWRQIVGTRHRIVHGYDEVDLDAVWTIVTSDLPTLLSALEAGLGDNASR